jgi:hypothetical protein
MWRWVLPGTRGGDQVERSALALDGNRGLMHDQMENAIRQGACNASFVRSFFARVRQDAPVRAAPVLFSAQGHTASGPRAVPSYVGSRKAWFAELGGGFEDPARGCDVLADRTTPQVPFGIGVALGRRERSWAAALDSSYASSQAARRAAASGAIRFCMEV